MTKEEAIKKIEELKEFIEICDNKAGFKDDEIFLLSIEEYEKYKDIIPEFSWWWWLRSPGDFSDSTAGVYSDGSVHYSGRNVYYNNNCVRPAIKTNKIIGKDSLKIGQRFLTYCFPWIYLGNDIAIAEVPIATHRFDKESNDYENSKIRQFLKEWLEERR